VNWIRLAIFALVVVAIALAAVPLLILVDLVNGGSGFGLCPGGLGNCRRQYTTGPELAALLMVLLLAAVGAIRLISRLARRLQPPRPQ
jgi:hypothetical protein